MDGVTQFELTNEYLDRLKEAIDQQDISFIKESLAGVKPADITDTLHEFNAEDSKYVIDLLEPEIGAEIIKDLDEDVRLRFLKSFTPDGRPSALTPRLWSQGSGSSHPARFRWTPLAERSSRVGSARKPIAS